MRDLRNGLNGLNRCVAQVERWLAGSLLMVVVLAVLSQVVMRHVFASPNPWSEELSRFCFIWLSMLGAAIAVDRKSHFAFDQAIRSLPARYQWKARISRFVVVLAGALAFLILGAKLVQLARGQHSPALDVPMTWIYASVPVTGALMLFHLLAGAETTAAETSGED
jgi:TRAP-type C4-dicarboxylate transport system permease small subunit